MIEPFLIPFIKGYTLEDSIPTGASYLEIKSHNWSDKFPYAPNVKAHLWHDGENLYIKYEVKEEYIAAIEGTDNGEVWNDSCVEFFISFDADGYYNIESNCIGTVLVSHRKGKNEDIEFAERNLLNAIKRFTTLGRNPFRGINFSKSWRLLLIIPIQTFFLHGFAHFNGIKAKCNLYKCGDKLLRPHFMSWQPIKTATPDFHRPEFFADIIFEN